MRQFVLLLICSCLLSQNWYKVEPNHSTVAFSIPVAGITKVTGKFSDFLVYIDFDSNKLAPVAIEAAIEAKSINTGIDARDTDLQGENFFHIESYPKITFRSNAIRQDGENWIATGEFSLRDVKKTIELPFKLLARRDSDSPKYTLGIAVRSSLNRLDYNVGNDWKHTLIPNFLGNIVAVEFDMWARPTKKKTELF